jgi:hypothetical protein
MQVFFILKLHKNENFFGSDFEFCPISLLVMLKWVCKKKDLVGPFIWGGSLGSGEQKKFQARVKKF